MISTFFYFIVALFILITVHEFGHFIVARGLGVKVLRFSFGFGKVLAAYRDKKGTEFVLSLIPLGGYVKMLDEEDEAIPVSQQHMAFNRQPYWKKSLIVLAGPLFNFMFTFFVLYGMLCVGSYTLAPIVDKVAPHSIAQQSGITPHDELTQIDGHPLNSWKSFYLYLLPLIGQDQPVSIQTKSVHGDYTNHLLNLKSIQLSQEGPDILEQVGIAPFIPKIKPIVDKVLEHSPAQSAGLRPKDQILAINGKAIKDFLDINQIVGPLAGQQVKVKIKRQAQTFEVAVTLKEGEIAGKKVGILGIQAPMPKMPKEWIRHEQYGPIEAIPMAFDSLYQMIKTTVVFTGRLFSGNLDTQHLSGPIGIAKDAGASGRLGLMAFLSFMAVISVSLGVLNLLPIPMLDGGQFVFFCIEAMTRRELNQNIKKIGMGLSLLFLLGLTVLALSNDLTRISAG